MANIYDDINENVRRLRNSSLFGAPGWWLVSGSDPKAHYRNLTEAVAIKSGSGEKFLCYGTITEPATASYRDGLFAAGQHYHFAAGTTWDIVSTSTNAYDVARINTGGFAISSDGPIRIPIGVTSSSILFYGNAAISGLNWRGATFLVEYSGAVLSTTQTYSYLITSSSSFITGSDLGRWIVRGSVASVAPNRLIVLGHYIQRSRIAIDLAVALSPGATKYLHACYLSYSKNNAISVVARVGVGFNSGTSINYSSDGGGNSIISTTETGVTTGTIAASSRHYSVTVA